MKQLMVELLYPTDKLVSHRDQKSDPRKPRQQHISNIERMSQYQNPERNRYQTSDENQMHPSYTTATSFSSFMCCCLDTVRTTTR